jgi:Lrp/AsnC family transcriptional regulator, regulator for asnA, asnC and gidA
MVDHGPPEHSRPHRLIAPIARQRPTGSVLKHVACDEIRCSFSYGQLMSTPANGLLDDIGKAIIEQLQEDGRRPYASIGRAVGLSEAAVRQRVQRLQDTGVIQVVAVTDPLQLGLRRQAMIGVTADGDLTEVADAMAELPEVDYVVITAGRFDLLVEAVCEDDEHLLHLVGSRIRAVPGVRSVETFVYMKLRKQHYNWGTR